jgi:Fe-S-cluster containining protein
VDSLRELRLSTDCRSCVHKCCSQPYDWVFLTRDEILKLKSASGLSENEFVSIRSNPSTSLVFRTLNLPCRFLDTKTGQCNVYDSRPLVCQLFPFYLEPLTGHATLLPVQCGPNLRILDSVNSDTGWRLKDFEQVASEWLADIWRESAVKK